MTQPVTGALPRIDAAAVEYMGPALVRRMDGLAAVVLVEGVERDARLALAQLYRPEPGDTVLVLGGRDGWYVVGVLAGAGRMVVNAPGDLELRARGTVEIHGARGVNVRGPEVAVAADRLSFSARVVFERVTRAYRHVKELLQVRAGRARTVVEDAYTVQAQTISETAKGDVKLDGDKIHLG